MTQGGVIDCCFLINLYTGWGDLSELPGMGWQWYLCEAVLKEAEFTREYGEDGAPVSVPLDFSQLVGKNELLKLVAPSGDEEIEDYFDFACEEDDGEAQALAIAKHRGFTLLTDDRKALRLAARQDIAVATMSTVEVLQAWANLSSENDKKLYETIERIENLARYTPRKDSPDYVWWSKYRERK